VDSGLLPQTFIDSGPWGIGALRPYQLFGLTGLDPISHAMLWSMVFNLGSYVTVSLLSRPNVIEHSQATLFVDVFSHSSDERRPRFWRGSASVENLRSLLSRFLGAARTDTMLADYAGQRGLNWDIQLNADAELVDFAEKRLAGAIGAASARAMVASVVKEEPLSTEEVLSILDETSQVIAYSHRLEQKSRELEAATAELREANEQLKELDRLKDDFMSTVTHELRTPLTSIRAFSEILHDNPELDVSRRHKFAEIILKESERLTRLINNVLDISKIESGKMEWTLSSVALANVINDALLSTEQLFQEKDIELQVNLQKNIPPIVADRDRIMQVLLNLLSNAIKFCDPEAGKVSVQLRTENNTLRVDVADNGPGIHPRDIDIVFEKFRQVGDTLTGKPQGTGLGLPICREIISHFGGELWVESTPGHGATFSFTLPVRPPVATEDSANGVEAARPTTAKYMQEN
jgi:signal transduction histidine kinase